jgi:hypothetical protein
VVPALGLAGGVVALIASWLGGQPILGVVLFAIMAAYVAVLMVGGRSELVRMLRGQHADERYESFDLRATAFAGVVMLVALFGCFLYELVRGEDGQPYSALAALGGFSYLTALLWLRVRS